jgi:hypothetical protein
VHCLLPSEGWRFCCASVRTILHVLVLDTYACLVRTSNAPQLPHFELPPMCEKAVNTPVWAPPAAAARCQALHRKHTPHHCTHCVEAHDTYLGMSHI